MSDELMGFPIKYTDRSDVSEGDIVAISPEQWMILRLQKRVKELEDMLHTVTDSYVGTDYYVDDLVDAAHALLKKGY
jgi:hypothetical protein